MLHPFAFLNKKPGGLDSDSLPELQSKRKDGIFDLNTGLVYTNSCAGLVSIFPGETHSGDNDGKLPPPLLDSWVYQLLKDCVSVLTKKYLQPLENQAHDGYFMYLHILRDKGKITSLV